MITVQNESRSIEYHIPTKEMWVFDRFSPNVISFTGSADDLVFTVTDLDRVMVNQVPNDQVEIWLDERPRNDTLTIHEWWDIVSLDSAIAAARGLRQ